MIITKDAVDYFYTAPEKLFITPKITLVLSLAQLQKLGKEAKLEKPVQFSMGLPQLVAWLQNFTAHHACQIVTYHQANILVASKGKVSTTQVGEQESWRVKTSAHAAVWWLQNPSKPLEALTTAVFEAYKDAGRVGAHTHPSSE